MTQYTGNMSIWQGIDGIYILSLYTSWIYVVYICVCVSSGTNDSCRVIRMSHVTWMTHLRHMNDSFTSHEWLTHVTRNTRSHVDRTNCSRHTNDSCHMNSNESRPIVRMTHVTCYEWVTPYKWLTWHGWHKQLSGTCVPFCWWVLQHSCWWVLQNSTGFARLVW